MNITVPVDACSPNSSFAAPAQQISVPRVPLTKPNPPKLSRMVGALEDIEASGIFSNFGPVNTRLEAAFMAQLFQSNGACVTVANATLGLMLAIRQAIGWQPRGRYALIPSFTFAATAQAAIWCGLTPLFCDVDRETWLPDASAETALLRQYGDDIALILPNATFGNCLDLARYDRLSTIHGIPVVIDAAACLGSVNAQGQAFGLGSRNAVVFSMHATKAFSTGEGGLIYCADEARIAALRTMANFGLSVEKLAVDAGINAKLGEVGALLALSKLNEIDEVATRRQELLQFYQSNLPDFEFQRMTGQRSAIQFVSALVPQAHAGQVPEIISGLAADDIGAAHYFAPHLATHPFFKTHGIAAPLPVTEDLCRRIISLPMADTLNEADVAYVCDRLLRLCPARKPRRRAASGYVGSAT